MCRVMAEFNTPRGKGGVPNMAGLDEKTAKILLEERQVGGWLVAVGGRQGHLYLVACR